MYHELCAVLLPPIDLMGTFRQWGDVVALLCESKRNRPRQMAKTTLIKSEAKPVS
jgi:hypothetical protein